MQQRRSILSILLILALLFSMAPPVTFAAETVPYAVEGGNIYFDISTGTVTGCDTSVTVVDIPAEIESVAVTRIAGVYRYGDRGCGLLNPKCYYE